MSANFYVSFFICIVGNDNILLKTVIFIFLPSYTTQYSLMESENVSQV